MVLLIPIIFTACYFSDISSESPPLEWTKRLISFFLFFSLSPMLIASLIAKTIVLKVCIILGCYLDYSWYRNDRQDFLAMMMLGELIEGYNGIFLHSALPL